MKSNYDNQKLDAEELKLDELFTDKDTIFLSPDELEEEKEKLKSYKVVKATKNEFANN